MQGKKIGWDEGDFFGPPNTINILDVRLGAKKWVSTTR